MRPGTEMHGALTRLSVEVSGAVPSGALADETDDAIETSEEHEADATAPPPWQLPPSPSAPASPLAALPSLAASMAC